MGDTIRKGEMSRRVAEAMDCSIGEGEKALNAVIESVTDAMRAGDRIVLTGLGTFELVDVKARRVRPIRGASSGELIEVPRIRACAFGRERISRRWRGNRRRDRQDTHPKCGINANIRHLG